MAREEEDDIKTVLIQKLQWLPPVDTVSQLPPDAAEGTHCFVEGPDTEGEEIWKVIGGAWVQVDEL